MKLQAMNYSIDYLRIKSEIEAKACPIHNIRPLAKIENDHITLRCCCDMFTSKCMSEVDRKLSNNETILNIIDAWERDLFVNGLQAG
jgi:hypothetical protein